MTKEAIFKIDKKQIEEELGTALNASPFMHKGMDDFIFVNLKVKEVAYLYHLLKEEL